jgi:hypothetical protein
MAGKSDILLLYPLIHKFHEMPKFKGVFFRRTFPELQNEIIPRSEEFYPAVGGVYNENKKVWKFPSGARIFFGHLEKEKDVHNYDTMQINYAAFDELTSFTQNQYIYITLQRVRATIDSGLPQIVRSASNPGNIGHTWVFNRFIKPCITGNKVIKNAQGNLRIFVPAKIYDNPYVDPEYLQGLQSLPEAEKKAKLDGDWSAYEGQVFTEFRDVKYSDEPANALHVIPAFDIPSWWPRMVVIDWGKRAMNYITYSAISPAKRVYVYREQAWIGKNISEWGAEAKLFIDKDNPRLIRVCKSAGQERGQDHTIQDEIESALDRRVELTTNTPGSRVANKQLLHEYLRWEAIPIVEKDPGYYDEEFGQWLLRNKSQSEYLAYRNSFVPASVENNIPRLQIFENCPELVNAIKTAQYVKPNDTGKKPEDVAEWDGDDPYDNIRYVVDAAERFFIESSKEMDRIAKEDNLAKRLAMSGNQTAYYMSMRRHESENRIVAVKRFHR